MGRIRISPLQGRGHHGSERAAPQHRE
jgi:hypothetical protein